MKPFETREQELMWFVGLYEGEGSMYTRKLTRTHTLASGEVKTYEYPSISLTIKMTDEDVIERAANFLGQKYAEVERADRDKRGYKRIYRVRQTGGPKGKLRKLLDEMRPHLSKRRVEQMDYHLNRYK